MVAVAAAFVAGTTQQRPRARKWAPRGAGRDRTIDGLRNLFVSELRCPLRYLSRREDALGAGGSVRPRFDFFQN